MAAAAGGDGETGPLGIVGDPEVLVGGVAVGAQARVDDLGGGEVRLLAEGVDLGAARAQGRAAADVAIAGLGPRRRHAEGDDMTLRGQRRGMLRGGAEGGGIGNVVIRRRDQQHRSYTNYTKNL